MASTNNINGSDSGDHNQLNGDKSGCRQNSEIMVTQPNTDCSASKDEVEILKLKEQAGVTNNGYGRCSFYSINKKFIYKY